MSLRFDNSGALLARSLRFLLFFLLLLSITMACQADMGPLDAIAKGNLVFTTNLYKILRETEGNIFFSPISIEVILALAYTGAAGRTATQMAAALHLPEDNSVLKAGFHSLMESLKSSDNMTLEIANKLFGQKNYPFEDSFKAVAKKSFLSAAEEMDFGKEPEACRNAINQWVEERTNRKITDLIRPGLITSLTRLVLVNAIYFKGLWKFPFDAKNTYEQPFYLTKSETKNVQMMHIKKKFRYAERDDLDCKVLVMPYEGEQISMMILLPNAIDGLPALESQLDKIDMNEVLNSAGSVEVEVTLPRFKLENSIDLNSCLMRLGMTDMFSEDLANFSGISREPGLYVSNVVQKAFIEVNEEGSEAAAATVVLIRKPKCEYIELAPPPEFKADHPFIFLLVYGLAGGPIFIGRLQEF